jgi:hypothetical protein
MDMQAILKAGGIGAAVIIVLNLFGLIPCVGCITFILVLLAYAGVGVLAALWMKPPRTAGSGATNGAIAAVVAALIAGLINIFVMAIYSGITGASQLSQVPPEQLQVLIDAGIDPAMLVGPLAAAGIGAFCCTIYLFIGAALGAIGVAIWGNTHPN